MGRKPSFEEYCAEHGVTEDEMPAAFAAYLHLLSEGRWDGRVEQVRPPDADAEDD